MSRGRNLDFLNARRRSAAWFPLPDVPCGPTRTAVSRRTDLILSRSRRRHPHHPGPRPATTAGANSPPPPPIPNRSCPNPTPPWHVRRSRLRVRGGKPTTASLVGKDRHQASVSSHQPAYLQPSPVQPGRELRPPQKYRSACRKHTQQKVPLFAAQKEACRKTNQQPAESNNILFLRPVLNDHPLRRCRWQ